MDTPQKPQKSNNYSEFWRNEAIAFLALSSIKGIGFWTLHKIAMSRRNFKEILKSESPDTLNNLGRNVSFKPEHWIETQSKLWEEGISIAKSLHESGVRLIFRAEKDFPSPLKDISDPPLWLFIQGSQENLHRNAVTIIGTRQPSEDGIFLTKMLVAALHQQDCVTVSGLATGIDQTAHRESIRYNLPTVAILGNGIFIEFPTGSNSLRREILQTGGTVVSEYLPHQSYSAENFIRRNRIQAALAKVLIPVEWKIKSGSAHTVNFALDYNRSLIAVHLPTTSPQSTENEFIVTNGGQAFVLPQRTKEAIEGIKSSLTKGAPTNPQIGLF